MYELVYEFKHLITDQGDFGHGFHVCVHHLVMIGISGGLGLESGVCLHYVAFILSFDIYNVEY